MMLNPSQNDAILLSTECHLVALMQSPSRDSSSEKGKGRKKDPTVTKLPKIKSTRVSKASDAAAFNNIPMDGHTLGVDGLGECSSYASFRVVLIELLGEQ